jgi:hypothetical protein
VISDESIDIDGFISLVEPAMVPKFLNDFLASRKGFEIKTFRNIWKAPPHTYAATVATASFDRGLIITSCCSHHHLVDIPIVQIFESLTKYSGL